MKILQITNKSPIPPTEGGPIAMYNLAQTLIQHGHTIDVITIETPKFTVNQNTINSYQSENYKIKKVFIDTRIKPFKVLLNLLVDKPYIINRFKSFKFEQELKNLLSNNNYDVVIFETLYSLVYLKTVKRYSNAICIYRSHNYEPEIWERLKINEKNFLKKLYITHLIKQIEKFQIQILPQIDGIATISKNEMKKYEKIVGSSKPIENVVFSFFKVSETIAENTDNIRFYIIGSMNWLPNIEGLKWFMEEVAPLLKNFKSEIFIAGRHIDDKIKQYEEKFNFIKVVGEVESVEKFIKDKHVLLVPLFSGSGIRIKIVEAMSYGKAVISTSVGCEGINVTHNENIIIADSAVEFANAILYLTNNKEKAIELGENAMKLIKEEHNSENTYKQFEALLDKIKLKNQVN